MRREYSQKLKMAANQNIIEREYWLEKLSGELEKACFPPDYKNKTASPLDSAVIEISDETVSKLAALSKGSDYTLNLILVTAVTILLSKYSGSNDIVLGMPIYKQEADGDFINHVLALRNLVEDHMTVKLLLMQVRQTIKEAVDHLNYPVEMLVEQLGLLPAEGEFPLFDAAVVLKNIHHKNHIESIRPHMIFCFQRNKKNIEVQVEYNPLLYREDTVQRIARHLQTLLKRLPANLEEEIGDIDLLSDEEKKRLILDFNDTGTDYPANKTLHRLFEEQAARTPCHTAAVGRGLSITYNEIDEQSNRLAHVLRQKGVGPDTIVGLMKERSVEMIIGILGILKAGGAYLPIDPEFPEERIDYMLKDSNARVLVSEKFEVVDVNVGNRLACSAANDHLHLLPAPATSLAYIIYTSGTTGKPRGVLTTHRNAVRVVKNTNYIEITPEDRVMQISNYAFDGSIFDIFGALLNGAVLVLMAGEGISALDRLSGQIKREQVTAFFVTTALFNALVDIDIDCFKNIRKVLFGGERVSVEHSRKALEYLGKDKIIHVYGPTETTVYASYYFIDHIEENAVTIPIGKPISNTTTFILGNDLHPVPAGVHGELYIGGHGLARGYLNQPELTAEKFIDLSEQASLFPTPHSPTHPLTHSTIYRTGDLARWLWDGNIEFVGRRDFQVKIRGFRIEPGEIESHLLQHENIEEAVVINRKNQRGDTYLCAYIVPVSPEPGEGLLNTSQLREYLSRFLPDYMIPAFFVSLEKIPLNPNGKLDKKALPEPAAAYGDKDEYIAPRDEVEEKLVGIWSDVLGRDPSYPPIGIGDNFFEIGGHSLRATEVIALVHKIFEVDIKLREFFSSPFIRELAKSIREAEAREYIEIQPVEQREYYDLSYAQRRLWVLCQFEAGSTAYNMPGMFPLAGRFDAYAFEQAVQTLIDRREILRTVFVTINGQQKQEIIPNFTFGLEQNDLQHLDEAARKKQAEKIYITDAGQTFDLEKGPLFRFRCVRLEEEKFLVIFIIHHIISDGWSQGIIRNEILTLYNAFLDGKDKEQAENLLPRLKLQYRDYTCWHNGLISGDYFSQAREFWLGKFQDKPNGIELPTDHPRKPVQTFNGKRLSFLVDSETMSRFNRLRKEEDVTLFMGLLSLVNIFLYKYTGQADIILGSPIAGRRQPELHHMTGFLVNTLVYRNRVLPQETFRQHLRRVRKDTLACYDYQDYPFDLLVDRLDLDRDLSRSPLFNVMLAYNNTDVIDKQLSMEGLSVTGFPQDEDFNMSKFDLTFFMSEVGESLAIRLEYNTDLFEHSTIRRMADNFLYLAEKLADNFDIPISQMHTLHPGEYQKVTQAFNDTHADYPREKTIRQLFEEQAARTPDGVAVVGAQGTVPFNDIYLTYRELNEQSNQLARVLMEKGVKPNTIVGLMVERSIEMIIGILGILKAGGAYLPIDPEYPRERIEYMLKDSNAAFLFTGRELLDVCKVDVYKGTACCAPTISPVTSLAYIIYTSGTTGKPKGVMVEHGGVFNTIYWRKQEYGLTPDDYVLQLFSFSFDGFITSFFTPIVSGSRVVLPGDEEAGDVFRIKEVIISHRITHFICVPSMYASLLETCSPGELDCLRVVTVAGEGVKPSLVEKSKHLAPNLEIVNEYGATENTVVASVCRNIRPAPVIPIGKPTANTRIYILDRDNRLVPIGAAGELCIAGAGVARGYLNRPELTAEKFVFSSYRSYGSYRTYISKKIYKTGDLARWLPDGNIEFLGRIDLQVKLRGYRIELGEIESRLLDMEGITEAVVTAREDRVGEKYLCAYLVSAAELDPREIKGALSRMLPGYMIPAFIVRLERMPLTSSGKVDGKALASLGIEMGDHYAAPGNEIEMKLVEIWGEVLGGLESVGIDDNFFELGGHSLKATIVVARIHETFHIKTPLKEFFTRPTIREMAEYIGRAGRSLYRGIGAVEKKEYYALSSAQKRLYFLQEMAPETTAYNIPFILPLSKSIDREKIGPILKQLIVRHESLRTSFVKIDEAVMQRIHEPGEIDFSIDYYNADDIEAKETSSHFFRSFDLNRPPLMRSGIITLPDGNHIWMVDMHHIIADGTSSAILTKDFLALYSGETLPEQRFRYKDFSEWQNRLFASGTIKGQEDYWLELYSGEIPRLNLPEDFKRPEIFNFTGDHYRFKLDIADASAFRRLGVRSGATLYMNMLAVLDVLFYKYTGHTDIIIGTGIAGRPHMDLQGIIGMFVNTLPMRNHPRGDKSYEAFLNEVIDNCVSAFENQDVQFEELVDKLGLKRDTSRNPLFDIMMVVQNFRDVGEQQPLPDETLPSVQYGNPTSKFDITFFINEYDRDIYISIEYYTAVFKKDTIKRLVSHLYNIIKSVIKNPCLQLKDIDIISEEEKKQVLYEFNAAPVEFYTDKTILELFSEQVERTPDRTALVYKGEALDYREFGQKSDQLARYLYHGKGVYPGDRVGIWLSPSIHRPVSIIGVLKAGAAYVPIDPALPRERIKYMINDASIGVVISEKKFLKGLNRLQWECRGFHSYLCVDSPDIHEENEIESNELMDKELWYHVGETAGDDITGGGWISSYTGEPLSREEMDEHGDNILKKLAPLLHPQMRVLEIGCASGISMYRIAPNVGLYYGTDLSAVIIEKNKKRVEEEGHRNIKLSCLAAHEIDKLGERNFDLVIMNSVIQCFHGHNYLRKVIRKAVEMLGEKGYLFIGDIMNQEKKAALVRELTVFKQDNRDKPYTTKTDFSSELFVSRGFWTDLEAEWQEIENVEFTEKIYTVENELTKFRYDTLISINKTSPVAKKWVRLKHQDDLRNLPVYGSGVLHLEQPPDSLAYVIYTSGTTGQPRGVAIEHSSLVNLCGWHNRVYRIANTDNAALYAGFGFDASAWELFPYIIKGASIHIIDESLKLDIDALNDYYENHNITISFLPTQMCEQFMEKDNRSLRVLLTGGDKLRRFAKKRYDLYNNYGPTENTVVTTYCPVKKAVDNIPIGKPVDNTGVYILDRESLRPQPMGIAGELCISGVGLARGYLNRPELTAEKFLSISYRSYRSYRTYISQKTYKTGDLARWLADGNIEFLGRIDHQVKIRGYRIELGEIESQLLAAEGIKEALVTAREDENSDKYLCAYIVVNQGQAVDIPELRSEVSAHLPDYMVPAYFIQLDDIPLTPNGKVDRRKLPKPEIRVGKGYTAPLDSIEEKLVEIWADILNIAKENIGINTSFFDVGGQSLKAAVLTARVHKEFNVKIPLVQIFTAPTIKDLSGYIRRTVEEHHISIEPAEEKEYYPLSSAQKRLYVLHQFASDSIYYNMPYVTGLEETIAKEKLELAFKKLVARHDSLRTSFETANEEPVQKIHKEVDFSIDCYKVNDADAEDIIPGFTRPFDLSKAPLLRVSLITAGASRQVLFMDMHHIITDGTSQEILQEEFAAFYWKEAQELPPLRLQYKDYSQWLNSKEQGELRKQQEVYWLKEFTYDELPVLNLPTDYPRPFLQSFEGNLLNFALSARETGILKDIAKDNDVTLYMILLAVFNILFSKLSGQEDVVLGTPIAARRHTDLQQVIGMMVNTLPMRNYPSADKPFNRFLMEVKQRTLDAYENQEYPFEELVGHLPVARDTSRNPVFDIMLNLLNQSEYSGEITEINDRPPYEHKKMTSRFDMLFNAFDMKERIYFVLEYSTRLFTPATIERFIRYLKNIILALPGNTGQKLSDIEYIPAEEKEVILEFCTGVKEIPGAVPTVHQLFEERAGEVPDRTALVFEERHLGYRELNEKSGQVARTLKEKGVLADDIVAIMFERSLEMIIAILGILKAGCAYLPIDPEYPQERIDFMLKDSRAKMLLTNLSEGHLIHHSSNQFITHHSSNLVYIIYTSGTTGKPRGVMLEHQNLVNLIRYQYRHTTIDFTRVLQFTTISFDVSAQEIFSTLLAGGRLVLMDKETLKDIPELFGLMTKEYIKTLFAPASFLKFVMNEKESVDLISGSLKHIVTAGEQVIVNEGFREYLRENSVYLHNHYGPSETHVVTALTLDPDGEIPELPSIGQPVSNTDIYILDKGLHLVPQGVAGELVIGGMQVGRGYLNQPELTAEGFRRAVISHLSLVIGSLKNSKITNDQCPMTNDRFYRTGDLARWLTDGNLEFLGRLDHQVKIRGFRVELGEIESQLLNHEQVNECVVVAREDDGGGRYLCAYIVSQEDLEISELRQYLGEGLPDYMVPSYFVFLNKIPLTPNRKVDRRALPPPEVKAGDNYIAPGDPLEEKLAGIWADVLKIGKDSISVESSFFELGGHSLTAAVLAAKVHKEFQVKLPLVEIFRVPTIRGLSRYLQGAIEDKYSAVEPVEKKEYYALSSAQRRLYFLQQMAPNNILYNMPQIVSLKMDIDRKKLEDIFRKLISRHESLRTSFETVKDQPVQRVREPQDIDFSLQYYEAKGKKVEEIMLNFVSPFDLFQAPLLRAALINTEEKISLLLIDMHHTVTDGTSQDILSKEFLALHAGEELPGLNLQYKDYSDWQNSEKQQEARMPQEEYWLREFSDGVPVLILPLDYPRPAVQSFEGAAFRFVLNKEETLSLYEISRKNHATLFMTLLAIFNVLFYRLSGQDDIILGTVVSGRRHADLEKIIGMLVNTLALRNYPENKKSFTAFLAEVKEKTLAAFENQDYPFEDLVEKAPLRRDASRNPVFDVMFSLQNQSEYKYEYNGESPGTAEPGKAVEISGFKVSKFDMTLNCMELGHNLLFNIEYCTKLFKPETIQRFIGYFQRVISSIIRCPEQWLSGIELLTAREKEQLLYDFNDTYSGYPMDKTIHQLFGEQAGRTPDGVAVVGSWQLAVGKRERVGERGERVQLTYRALNAKSNQLAHLMRQKGVGPDTIVGLMMERSIEMIIGILGILKAGGAYLPIDPEYPDERKQYMLTDSGAKILLTNLSEGHHFHHSSNQLINHHSSNLAYIIYTSGSTGKPKGTMIEHRPLVNQCTWHGQYYEVSEADHCTQYADFGFDASVFEIFPYLINGAALHIIHDALKLDMLALKEYYVKHNITITFLPTQFCQHFIEEKTETPSLRAIVTGGEKLNRFVKRSYHLYNNYGPTENTVVTTVYPVEKDRENIPIGKPVYNNRVFILEKDSFQLQPIGVPGELCVSGDSLARGYLNQPELTAERFGRTVISHSSLVISSSKSSKVTNDQCLMTNDRLYRTGDLARWLWDGNIEFLGRIDQQVKIRGFRIELGEIENRLRRIKGIEDAVVITRVDNTGHKYLCGYIIGLSTNTEIVKEYLSKHLPSYMIPHHLVRVDKIPLTSSGKVNRKELPEPEVTAGETYTAPRNEIDEKLVRVWSEVLGIEKEIIGIDSNFFELGGNSIKLMTINTRINQVLSTNIPVVKLFTYPSIRALSNYLAGEQKETVLGKDRSETLTNRRSKLKERKRR